VAIRRVNGRLELSEHKYWDLNFPREHERAEISEQDAIEQVREGLLNAVSLRMVADVPAGCYLYGGIDSCSILGLASALSQNPIKAFTIGFDDSDYDESKIAREMAAKCGADHDVMMLSGSELYGHFEETLWHAERTIYNTLGVAKLLMS